MGASVSAVDEETLASLDTIRAELGQIVIVLERIATALEAARAATDPRGWCAAHGPDGLVCGREAGHAGACSFTVKQ